MSLNIDPVQSNDQIAAVSRLAHDIWNEHYSSIITQGQIDYMVETFQSTAAIAEQLRLGGYSYYLIVLEGNPIGYLAVKPDDGKLFLSKLYIRKDHRGRGLASRAFAFVEDLCQADGLSAIWLTVNRHNSGSIAVYEKKGFRTVRTQVADIGGGYVMDDYVMEKPVVAVGSCPLS
ncbi:GNAT family N-acetyltransferase [Cohnella fermenti]|uniref:GNAT family N-acetyltransferase n=1 Tax=Cohnella fermenti TaxID=2565925 RepID=A0A4S4BMH5_9BACL|nr:GNAT family N-acetyltransferase [Cohnella fermenti]THF73615.1 GNAT family N-acetyltransferase [Cohnella fermenti]